MTKQKAKRPYKKIGTNTDKYYSTLSERQRKIYVLRRRKNEKLTENEFLVEYNYEIKEHNGCCTKYKLYEIFPKSFVNKTLKKFERLMKEAMSKEEAREYLALLNTKNSCEIS